MTRRTMMRRITYVGCAMLAGALLALTGAFPLHAQRVMQPCFPSCGPFTATVLLGPDKGLTLTGDMRLHGHGPAGNFTGTLKQTTGGTITVTGQSTGASISLFMHLGPGKTIFGTGVIGYDPDQKRGLLGGTFAGPRDKDLGSWAKIEGEQP